MKRTLFFLYFSFFLSHKGNCFGPLPAFKSRVDLLRKEKHRLQP